MIINITEESKFTPDKINIEALDNIAYQCGAGNHILMGSRELLTRISETPGLERRTSALIRASCQRMTQQGALLNGSPWRLDIDASNTSRSIPHLHLFQNPDYCEKSQILTENPDDAATIVALAKTYIAHTLRGNRISIRHNNGGGSTIGRTLKSIMDSPSGCTICIVDSDRKHEGAATGGTAKAGQAAYKKVKQKWRANLHLINQRELENLIPHDLLQHCVDKYAPHLSDVTKAIQETNKFYVDYFCMKAGDSMCRLISSLISKRQLKRLSKATQCSGGPMPPIIPCGTCICDGQCRESPGFGTGLLGWAATEMESGAFTSNPDLWRDELTDLVRKVAFTGLATQPFRA